jgi:hypothetical protein
MGDPLLGIAELFRKRGATATGWVAWQALL